MTRRDAETLFHGTYASFDRFAATKDVGFHFGCWHQAAARLRFLSRNAPAGARVRILEAAVDVRRPLVMGDDPCVWHSPFALGQLAPVLGRDAVAAILAAGDASSGRPVVRAVRAGLLEAGFDAVVYRNHHEGDEDGRTVGSGWSTVVLRPEDVRIVRADRRHPPRGPATPPSCVAAAVAAGLVVRDADGLLEGGALRSAFAGVARRLLGDAGCDGAGSVELGGRPGRAVVDLAEGRISVRMDDPLDPLLLVGVDDGVRRPGDPPATAGTVVVEALSTETVDEFLVRGSAVLGRVAGRIAGREATSAPPRR